MTAVPTPPKTPRVNLIDRTESPAETSSRDRFWSSLRKRIANGAKIRDGFLQKNGR